MRRLIAPLPKSHKSPWYLASCGSALCTLVAVVFCWELPAQGPAGENPQARPASGDFRSYTLRNVRAERIRDELAEMLPTLPEPGEVVADGQTNRLFVRGSERIQQLALQVIESLDVPPGAAPAPAVHQPAAHPVETPVLKPYPMLPTHEPQIMALEQRYASRPDVKIARDARTSQLLVLAPSAVHAHIEQVLSAQPAGPNGSQQPSGQQPVVLAGGAQSNGADVQGPAGNSISRRNLQLRNLTVDDVHARLERLMGRPLPLQEDASQTNVQFGIEAAPGARVSVAADRASGRLVVIGRQDLADSWARVISAMDTVDRSGSTVTRLVATQHAERDHLRLVAQTLSSQPARGGQYGGAATAEGQLVARLFQPGGEPGGANQGGNFQPPVNGQPPFAQPDGQQQPAGDGFDMAAAAGLIGQVQIEYIEGLDIIVIRGADQDVQQVMELINRIEELTQEAPLKIVVHPLQHVQSEALATLIQEVYDTVIVQRQGPVSITPLIKPNALLLIGREENVDYVVTEIISKLDVDVDPSMEFEVFLLEHASAVDVQARIQQIYGDPTGQQGAQVPTQLAPRVIVTADFRTNSLIVRAAPNDMDEIRALIDKLDTDEIIKRLEVREFKLRNALATDLAQVLFNALSAQATGAQGAGGQQGGFGQQQGGFGQQQQGGFGQGGAAGQQATQGSAMVEILTLDAQGRRVVKTSGVLTDIRITPDARSNTLLVRAPSESMDLIAALIQRLDQESELKASVKVFTIERGDAQEMATMLNELFGQTAAGGGGGGQFGGGGGGGQFGQGLGAITAGESTLIPLRVSVDTRTNSIIASGTDDALEIAHAILLTLDGEDVRNRQTRVFKLKNLFAPEVALALTNWLTSEQQIAQIVPGAISTVEQIEREAVIVAEAASNSLIVSATPTVFAEIRRIVEEMDARPPMVMVQVLIAEVTLNDTDEFGVEMAVQDSILFDRGILSNIVTTLTTTTTTTPGGAVTTVENETIQSANREPGFDFLNPLTSLGNSGAPSARPESLGTQGIANFGVGRVNSELGFGGFVFSAGSENLSILLRALQESRRLEVLSRPQIMALDNQFAAVQVGQRVPFITGTTITAGVQQNTLEFQEVGLILRVQPRVSPDGMVVMQIEAEKSNVGPEAEGIPVTTTGTGEVVRVPRINRTFAGTIVQAISGQTIVLGGLITKSTTDVHRRLPLIADIPILGDLFRYDRTNESRTELLIIMTPRVVRNYLDAEMVKQVEASRMSWVQCDVIGIHGPSGIRGRTDAWEDGDTEAIYPMHVPTESELLLPPVGGEIQQAPAPALGPTSDTIDVNQSRANRYDAAPVVYQHTDVNQGTAARQSVYDGLTPLPPTQQ